MKLLKCSVDEYYKETLCFTTRRINVGIYIPIICLNYAA